MGPPAHLPSLKKFVQDALVGVDLPPQVLTAMIDYEKRLLRLLDIIHEEVGDELYRQAQIAYSKDVRPTAFHEAIVRLFDRQGPIRIVTTNYDRLLSTAAIDYRGDKPAEYTYPTTLPTFLPPLDGIAYLHGHVKIPYRQLILRKNDFADAYSGEANAIARRFLADALREVTVVFIGYSMGDEAVEYFLRSLRQHSQMYALCRYNEANHWLGSGIGPIIYPLHSGVDEYQHLVDAVKQWSDDAPRWAPVPERHKQFSETSDDGSINCDQAATEDEGL